MHMVAAELGPEVCDALQGLHAVTRCDFNSPRCGIGKKKSFQMITETAVYQQRVSQLGTNATLSIGQASLCSLYTEDQKTGRKANDYRY